MLICTAHSSRVRIMHALWVGAGGNNEEFMTSIKFANKTDMYRIRLISKT